MGKILSVNFALVAIIALSAFQTISVNAETLNENYQDVTVIETENSYIIKANTQNEADMLEEVYTSMYEAKQALDTDFILIQHEDLSLTLYQANDDFSQLTEIKGFNNPNGLLGPNGIDDVLDAFVEYSS